MARFSAEITEVLKALHLFQKKVGKVTKDAANPFFKSRYATLNQVWETIQPILSGCQLTVVQLPDEDGLTTIIGHTSGEYISTTVAMPNIPDAQKHGGYITYMRRYALAGLGLVIDDDDDANELTTAQKKTPADSKAKARTLTGGKPKWNT